MNDFNKFISEKVKNEKVKYQEIELISNEELKNQIIDYCIESNIEIIYDMKFQGQEDYYKQIRKIRVLEHKESVELIELAQKGNSNARDKMIEHNLRLVLKLASYHSRTSIMPFDDLFQAGCEGLIKAIEKFDTSMGYKFSTYAIQWIKQSMIRTIQNESRIIRIPVHAVESIVKIKRYEMLFYEKNGYIPTLKELSEGLKMTEDRIFELKESDKGLVSLDAPLNNEESDSDTIKDTITTGELIEDIIIDEIQTDKLIKIIEEDKDVSKRNKDIFKSRYGLDGSEPKTLEAVGREYGITRERTRQIVEKCRRRYRYLIMTQDKSKQRVRK